MKEEDKRGREGEAKRIVIQKQHSFSLKHQAKRDIANMDVNANADSCELESFFDNVGGSMVSSGFKSIDPIDDIILIPIMSFLRRLAAEVADGAVVTSAIAVMFQCNAPKIAIIGAEKIGEKFMRYIDYTSLYRYCNVYYVT